MTVKIAKNLRRQKLGEVQGRGPEIEIEQKKKRKGKNATGQKVGRY
jgi:hypothetical protein